MIHGSLFSGIGGFDLAAEWMGWENKFHCEWNEFGQKVLKHYWPKSESFTDITKSNFKNYANRIDVLSGGFPCQPYSVAGKRLGKEDERHLWPEMLRAIREIQPSYVVGENVRGLTNWNGGLVFDEVQADLEAIGYEVLPFLLPACAVNAPHRRDRIWFIAYSKSASSGRELFKRQRQGEFRGCNSSNNVADASGIGRYYGCYNWQKRHISTNIRIAKESKSEWNRWFGRLRKISSNATNTNSKLHQGRSSKIRPKKTKRHFSSSFCNNTWQNFPTQSPICDGDDGISSQLDGITFPKWRNESIKAGGNAIVPQVALQIFKAIQQYENSINL